jgi:hypothetical protein
MQFNLIPNVTARVFAHVLVVKTGPLPCFSYVTTGLRAFGQEEFVFTVVRPSDAGIESAPQEPLLFLRTVANLASQGRLVSNGGLTEFGPTGLFGRARIRGVVYQTAWPMEGVEFPPGSLAAIALVDHEVDIVKRFGSLRVLARLGRASAFFPTAFWCDPERNAVCPPESETILNGVASAHLPNVSVVMEGEQIKVRLPRSDLASLQGLGLPPPDMALAFLTTIDDHADACLVWNHGQNAPEAIANAGKQVTRISGGFALFVPQQQADEANPFEDGFAFMLTDASWSRVREALLSGTSVNIPGKRSLVIEWFDRVPIQVEAPAVSEMQMHLNTRRADIESRLGMQRLIAYADQIEKCVQTFFQSKQGNPSVVTLEVVLAAGRPPAIQVADADLQKLLMAVAAPAVASGEVAFRGEFSLFSK